MSGTNTSTPDSWRIAYQAAADDCRCEGYGEHAERFAQFLSDEMSYVYRENTPFPVEIEEVTTGKGFFLFDMREVETPKELIVTHTYLLKESRIAGAYALSCPAITKRPSSKGFVMSNMYGGTEEAWGRSYDKGHFICHGAGGGGDWNLFPQLRSLNRGWTEEGKLYRRMEAYAAANPGTLLFSRPIYLDGSLCPALLDYGILLPSREVWLATFDNTQRATEPRYGRAKKVPMPPELQGIPDYGPSKRKPPTFRVKTSDTDTEQGA